MSGKLEFVFQFLVKCGDPKQLQKQLVIPNLVSNVLPEEAMFRMKLLDIRGNRHVVYAARLEDGTCLVSGTSWNNFVKSDPYKQFATLFFTWKKDFTFGIQVYCPAGLEYRRAMRPGEPAVNSQLIEANDYTFHQVVLSPTLLFNLNRNAHHGWETIAIVLGRKQNAKVTVSYHYYDLDGLKGKYACGFERVGWRNFCSQNNLRPDYKLKFTNNFDLTFRVDVFGPDGNIVDVHKEVFTDNKEMNYWPSSSDDDASPKPKSHKCRHAHPAHSKHASQCFQKISHHTVARNEMTVPKFFVRKHKLFNYGDGVLHFGQLNFPFHLAPRLDARRPGDLTHQVMIMDWTYFMGQTGVEEDGKLRFQFNLDDNQEDGTLHLDVC